MWGSSGVRSWTPFVQPMLPLGQILQNSNVNYHSYADDTQIYLALSPDDCSPLESLCNCLEQVKNWMNQNFLQLNQEKTEVIVLAIKRRGLLSVNTLSHCL